VPAVDRLALSSATKIRLGLPTNACSSRFCVDLSARGRSRCAGPPVRLRGWPAPGRGGVGRAYPSSPGRGQCQTPAGRPGLPPCALRAPGVAEAGGEALGQANQPMETSSSVPTLDVNVSPSKNSDPYTEGSSGLAAGPASTGKRTSHTISGPPSAGGHVPRRPPRCAASARTRLRPSPVSSSAASAFDGRVSNLSPLDWHACGRFGITRPRTSGKHVKCLDAS
jgi:hypothetical protein